MFAEHSRVLSEAEFSTLRDTWSTDRQLGDTTVGRRLLEAGSTLPIRFMKETDESQQLFVTLQSNDATLTVNRNDPDTVEAYGVVIDEAEDVSWRIPSDTVEGLDFLPTLQTAFHEADRVHDREADYRYQFSNGEAVVAAYAANPVDRLDTPVTFERMQYLGGAFPQKWLFQTSDGDVWYLRERSGSIRLYEGTERHPENCAFHAYVGRDHPGTYLKEDEVLNIVTSVEYINLVDDPDDVSEAAVEEYYDTDWDAFPDDISEPEDLIGEVPDPEFEDVTIPSEDEE